MRHRLGILVLLALPAACAGPTIRPALSPAKPHPDALLVLPGFGYGRADASAFRSLAGPASAAHVDVYVAPFLTRSGLATGRDKLARFVRDNRLDRYERVHVFAFLAGAWTFNPLMERERLPNLATVIYDRSPFQERAPRIAATRLRFLAWLRYGTTIFDVARTPYPALSVPDVTVGLMVESLPTPFITRYRDAAREAGPFAFECSALVQAYDDCLYLPMNHTDLYKRFAEVWPEVLAFIQNGRFSDAADRTPPAGDPLARRGRQ